MTNVLFVCLHNAGRSQMSQALFNHAAAGRHEGRSAGSTPSDAVHPQVIQVMDEFGLDLRAETPKRLSREMAEWADVVVTMGCGDACPYIPGKTYLEWDLADPKDQPIEVVRAVRDGIHGRVAQLLRELG